MTRKDFEFLTQHMSLMLKQGELSMNGFAYMCSQLDRDYSNFNRDRFEARVARLAGFKMTAE